MKPDDEIRIVLDIHFHEEGKKPCCGDVSSTTPKVSPFKKSCPSPCKMLDGRGTDLDLFLRELLAAPHLADLVGLVVPAWSARGAVVLPHAADALAATLPLLLPLLLPVHVPVRLGAARHRMVDGMLEAPDARAGNARHLSVRARVAAGAFQGRGAVLPLLLLPPVRTSRKGALR